MKDCAKETREKKARVLYFQLLNYHPCVVCFVFPSLTGWEVLVKEEEEQPGGEAFPGRAAPKGEPDRCASWVPGTGKRGAAEGSGRAPEELQPLQEDHGALRGQVRPSVRTDLTKTRGRLPTTDTSNYHLSNIHTGVMGKFRRSDRAGVGDGDLTSSFLRHTHTHGFFKR